MRKLTTLEAIVLLQLFDGRLNYIDVDPDDRQLQDVLISLTELKLIDPYDLENPVTEEGASRVYHMLSFGINYDRHFERATIEAKKAAFLSLINSGYEPRGLAKMVMSKLTNKCYSEFKNAIHDRQNLSMGTHKRPFRASSDNSNGPISTKHSRHTR